MRFLPSILFILLFLSYYQEINAQTQFGFTGGYISSVPFGEENRDAHFQSHYQPLGGYSIAIQLRRRNERAIDFGSELIYSSKSYGDKSIYGGLGAQAYFDTRNKLNHIGFGSFAEYTMDKKVRFHAGAGGVVGLQLSHTKRGTQITVHGGQQFITTHSGNVETDDIMDIRAAVRLGLEFPVTPQIDIVLENSYSMGLSGLKTKDFMLQLGFQFQMAAKNEK